MTRALPCGCDPSKVNGSRCEDGFALQREVREAWTVWTASIRTKMPAEDRTAFRQEYYEARDKMNTHYSEQEVLT